MTEVDRIVEAIKRVETGRDTPDFKRYWLPGDGGCAIGPWQLHADFFVEYWPPHSPSDPWQWCFREAVKAYVTQQLNKGTPLADIAGKFRQGVYSFEENGPDPDTNEYMARFIDEYNALGG